MNRRSALALPLLAAFPAVLTTAVRAAPVWGHDVSEIRYGGSDPATPARALALQALLGVPVRAIVLAPSALAEALNRGALECAALSVESCARAMALMGERLVVLRGAGVRRALPGTLGVELTWALLSV